MSRDLYKDNPFYQIAVETAKEYGHSELRSEHLLMAALSSRYAQELVDKELDIGVNKLVHKLKDFLRDSSKAAKGPQVDHEYKQSVTRMLQVAEVVGRAKFNIDFPSGLPILYAIADVAAHDKAFAKENEDLFKAISFPQDGDADRLAVGINDHFSDLAARIKKDLGIDVRADKEDPDSEDPDEAEEDENENKSYDDYKRGKKMAIRKPTPELDDCSTDLSKLAKEGKIDPVIGREDEIRRVKQILNRRLKNSPVLIGEPGVGKTAIAEGLALEMPEKRFVSLDAASLVADTAYRGQFEKRMKALVKEMTEAGEDLVVFVDELHMLVGAGSAGGGSIDAAQVFKPALARGQLQIIGATTLDEYRKYIEKDGALERRFHKVMVNPPSPEDTLKILSRITPKYEEHHHVRYDEKALDAIVTMGGRYITDRNSPDREIDVMDEAGSRLRTAQKEKPEPIKEMEAELEELKAKRSEALDAGETTEASAFMMKKIKLENKLTKALIAFEEKLDKEWLTVTADHVAAIVAEMTGIPVDRISAPEQRKLLDMEAHLKERVIGQDEAVEKVSQAIRRARAGMKDPKKPNGSFLFLGTTGVGKTELTKALAEYLFDDEDNMIRIDMSEYMEKFAVSRLIGAPPGYVGYEEGGQLTEQVRRKPYSVILLDEIEKAHPDVFNLLLQVLDDGVLTDSMGRHVDFKNTVIIMTSNAGARDMQNMLSAPISKIGFGGNKEEEQKQQEQDAKQIVEKALQQTFAPEFLNRIDDTVMFNPLKKQDMAKIVKVMMKGIEKRVKEQGFELKVTPAAVDWLGRNGFDKKFGARPMKRVIQKNVVDPLANEFLRGEHSGKLGTWFVRATKLSDAEARDPDTKTDIGYTDDDGNFYKQKLIVEFQEAVSPAPAKEQDNRQDNKQDNQTDREKKTGTGGPRMTP